jgi:phage gpG-like protein
MRGHIEAEVRGSVSVGLRESLDERRLLMAAGRPLLAGVERAFEQEGPGWAPLARRTVSERRRLGFGAAHPILHRTGRLRRSWKAAIDNKTLLILSDDPRAAVLQRPGPNRPARIIRIGNAAVTEAVRAIYRAVERGG